MEIRKGDKFELRDILNTPTEMVYYNNVTINGIEALHIRLKHSHLCFLSNIRIVFFLGLVVVVKQEEDPDKHGMW